MPIVSRTKPVDEDTEDRIEDMIRNLGQDSFKKVNISSTYINLKFCFKNSNKETCTETLKVNYVCMCVCVFSFIFTCLGM